MRYAHRVCLTCLVLLLPTWGVSVWAQQSLGSFSGTVTDPTGAVCPGVTVTAVEQGTSFTRSAVSSKDGTYIIPLLPPGTYNLRAEKAGFERHSQESVPLQVDQHPTVDIQLKVGSQSTTVTVEGTPPVLDTESYSVGTTVEQAKVQQLPFNGRHFLEATLFTPGVVPGSQGSELNNNRGGSINVNGLRETMNTFLLDGMSDTSIAVGTYSATPPLDSIQEFRLETGTYDAKFGTTAGAQVNIVTKSGTNQYRGTVYEYFRNGALDARNFFEPNVPPFHRNQFGASYGGPVVLPHVYDGHDKSFFFLNYEGLRDLHSFFGRGHVPDTAEVSGDLSELLPGGACPPTASTYLLDPLVLFNPNAPALIPDNNLNFIAPSFPSGTLDPVGQGLAKLYPSPNIANAPCGAENFTSVVKRKVYTNSYVGRFDHRWGTKNSIFYRYNLTTDSEFSPSGLPTGVPGFGTFRNDWFTATGLEWMHTFSPTLINEVKVDYNRWQYRWFTQDQGNTISQQLGIKGLPMAARDIGVPNLSFAGFDGMGSNTSQPQAGAVNTFEFADTVTQIHGNHSLAYGAQVRAIKRGNFYEDLRARGQFDFNGAVTGRLVLLGLQQEAATGQISQPQLTAILSQLPTCVLAQACQVGNGVADALFGIPTAWIDGSSGYISGTGSEFGFFGQDTWKARRNLTLTLGLRYEYNTLVTAKDNHFGGFDFNTNVCGSPGALLVAGTTASGLDCFVGTVNGQAGPFGKFVQAGTISLGGTAENRALQRPDHNNFGPRLGFAWQPFNSAKTVIRGGGGVYFDQDVGELYFQKSFNPPFFQLAAGNLLDNEQAVLGSLVTPPSLGGLPLGTGLLIQNLFTSPALAPALFPTLNPVVVNLEDSTIYQWSIGVQRELGRNWLVDLSYVGTRGLHLPFMWDPNQPNNALFVPGSSTCIPGTPGGTPCPRAFPNFRPMSYTDSIGKSIYHSLQLKLEKHYSKGLAVIGAYTYSKTLDTNSTYLSTDGSPNFPENSFNLAAEKGRADFDYRQRFSLAYVYDLPFGNTVARLQNSRLNYLIQGWQLSGIATVQSGAPFTPSVSGNPSNNIDNNDRPNIVSGQPFYPSHQSVTQWLNPAAFSVPASYSFGNAGRDILNGPGEADWDFSLIRKFRVTETKTLEFRAEMFNIFNQANFALPDGNRSNSTFGVIGNTVQPIAGQASGGPGDPRQIQFALRFTW